MNELAPKIEDLYLTGGEHERIMKDLDNVKPIQNANGQVVSPRDYLRPFYGSVVQSVREIYAGSVGWYQGDPTQLRPTPPQPLAARYVGMMGGGQKVNEAAQKALDNHEPEWAAELTSNVITAYVHSERPEEKNLVAQAKSIKADAFLKLAAPEINPNWRNFYITAAHELRGLPLPKNITEGLVAPGVIGALPAGGWVNSLTMRVRAELTAKEGIDQSMGFWFPGGGLRNDQGFGPLGYVLKFRGGIAEFIEQTPAGKPLSKDDVAKANLAISIEKPTLDKLLFEESKGDIAFRLALRKAYDEGHIQTLNGKIDDFEHAFFRWFEPKPVAVPPLAAR